MTGFKTFTASERSRFKMTPTFDFTLKRYFCVSLTIRRNPILVSNSLYIYYRLYLQREKMMHNEAYTYT